MAHKSLLLLLSVIFLGTSCPTQTREGDGWGWSEAIVTGALVGAGVTIAGKLIQNVAHSASSSWNHSYVTAVRDRNDRYARQYGPLIDTIMFSSSKKALARELSERYRSVKTLVYDFNCAASDFDGAISGLKSKLAEWQSQEDRRVMYREGRDAIDDAMPLQRRLHEANDSLQSQRAYVILYDVICYKSPELKHCEDYPYHVLLGDLESAKNELRAAVRDLECNCCSDSADRELLEKAHMKLDRLSDAYSRVIESAQYHHEKLEKLREQRHKELMEAQRRLEQAERERARAERELAQAERERARVEWERQESDLARLRRELRDLEDERERHSTLPSCDYVGVSVHIDM